MTIVLNLYFFNHKIFFHQVPQKLQKAKNYDKFPFLTTSAKILTPKLHRTCHFFRFIRSYISVQSRFDFAIDNSYRSKISWILFHSVGCRPIIKSSIDWRVYCIKVSALDLVLCDITAQVVRGQKYHIVSHLIKCPVARMAVWDFYSVWSAEACCGVRHLYMRRLINGA